MYFSCSCLRMKIAYVVPGRTTPRSEAKLHWVYYINNIPDHNFHDTLKNFHGMFNQFKATVVTPFRSTPFAFEQAKEETS